MSLFHVLGFGVKIGHLFWMLCCWFVSWFVDNGIEDNKSGLLVGSVGDLEKTKMTTMKKKNKMWFWNKISSSGLKIPSFSYQFLGSVKFNKAWWRKVVVVWVVFWVLVSIWMFWYFSSQAMEKRKETLASMCDERARMLQDQFNVSMNHVQAMSILISTFHHGKIPSAIDQRTFSEYTDRTSFERPLTSGVAYAMRVLHSEREEFERQQGWTIRRMYSLEQNPVHKDDYDLEALEPSPVQEEYAPVIFAQDTVSHVVSLDMLSGKEDRENVLRARSSGKGVLTAPFPLIKTNRLGVILTFAVYKKDLPSNATPKERIEATNGYLGGVFDIESLVENLLQQLASKQTILVNVYDTTNHSQPISMYGTNVSADGLERVSPLIFGDPFRKHEMRCRFKQKPPWPVLSMVTSFGILVIALLVAHIIHATVSRIHKVEEDCDKMKQLKKKAEAADVAKSQFLATVSHEIRTPMNGVLGMLHMLMDTELDVTQQDYVRTAQASGKALVSLINEVLDQAKIESGKLELEEVRFDLRGILDDVLSLFSSKSQQKGVELAVYISDRVPDMLIGDPGRFRQILTNLMGNSIKFTEKGHIFVTVHLVEELFESIDGETASSPESTLSGLPVADRQRSWENFKAFSDEHRSFEPSPPDINLIVSVEDTGVGIPLEAQSRIFTPFMQVGPSISRTHGGTGIGLSISKCLVGLMKGEIGFSSTPKVGSTFTFTAVFSNGMQPTERKNDPQNNNQPIFSEFRGMKAVVVDHRPARAKVSWYHFQRLGIRVEVVPRVEQALRYLKIGTTTVNMILIEQEIWNREADVFIKKLQKDPLFLSPKLILLANSVESSISEALCTGIDPPIVIVKPLRASMLAATLQRGLGIGIREPPQHKGPPALILRNLLLGRKILIVDDNNVNLRVAAGALKKYGADVVCAESGIKAISLLKPPHEFDACFMDIQMPEMDGFEATRRIRDMEEEMNKRIKNGEALIVENGNKTSWHLPVLAMTADVIQATHEECLKCGMDGYVSKPFEAEQLYREVSRFFNSPSDTES
ncbi:Histidine kinase/HSP90-like ATPase superfamily [Arabidopsis suecica]|uniref:histidine kinase n=1 Tax=Arabidopsis suecica TaxID=45249 RepID=A0A8T2CNF3_ARASU|nr:Histidine kinase/HSP90-like ATPase superfamily [Arabidopsis suecica]